MGFGSRFWLLIVCTFLGFVGMGTVLPSIGPHVRHDLGGSDRTVGFVIGTFSLMALGARFFSGPLADHRGRKAAFLTGLASCACSGVAYLLPIGLASAYLGRMFQGFGEACLYTGAAAWAVETAGIERSGQALGYVSTGIWGGISVGPMVGNWLGTFQHAAMLQAGLAALSFILLSRVPEDYQPTRQKEPREWLPKPLLTPGLAVGFVNVHYPVIAGFLILHLANHGNSGRAAFSAYALMVLTSRFFLGGLPDRINPAITFFTGISLMAVGLVVLAFAPAPPYAIIAAGVLGLGFSFPWSAIASTALRRLPQHQRGSGVSVLSAFYDLFVGTSSFAAGLISKQFGYSAAFLMAAFALIAAAMIGRAVFRAPAMISGQSAEELAEAQPAR